MDRKESLKNTIRGWKIAYKRQDKENSHIYANYKKGLWIQRAGKQLGSFDDFNVEKYPVIVQSTGGSEVIKEWFDEKKKANKFMREYMKK